MTAHQGNKLALVWLAVIVSIILLLTSCSVRKSVTTTKATRDSASLVEIDKLNHKINDLQATREKELKEAKSTGVVFEQDPCPPMPDIDMTCNADSLVKIIKAQGDIIRSMSNKIKINTDGSIEAQGKIKQAYANTDKIEKENYQLGIRNDELTTDNERLQTQVKSLQEEKTKNVKRSPGFPLWMLIVAFITGCIVWHNRTKVWKLFSIIKKTTMKTILFILLTMLFVSCGHHSDGSSVWAGPLGALPWVVGAAAVYSWYRFFKEWLSGTRVEHGINDPVRYTYEKKKMNPTQIGAFIFSVIFTLADIAIIWGVNADK